MAYRDRLVEFDTIHLDAVYFARIKKVLSRAEIRRAEHSMTDNRQLTTVDPNQKEGGAQNVEWKMDMSAYNEQLVLISIVEWNLEGPCEVVYMPGLRPCEKHAGDGIPWPLDIEHVGAMSSPDYATVLKAVQQNNRARSAAEQDAFRRTGEQRDHDGHENLGSGAGALLPTAGDVEAVRQD